VLTSRSQVGDVKHSDLPGMEALGREVKLSHLSEIRELTSRQERWSSDHDQEQRSSRGVPGKSAFLSPRPKLINSGQRPPVRGSKSVKSSMPSDKVGNSSTKEKSTITYST
jgi:hypothetical protein